MVDPFLPFPTSATDLAAIETFAINHNRPLTNSEALAVEIKTSWVESNLLAHPDEYITMPARVPDYDRSYPDHWTLNANSKLVTLALVGMHVVGSVKDHPKMVWATFEHKRNTPNAPYPESDGDQWEGFLFSSPFPDATQNQPTMQVYSTGEIVSVCDPQVTTTCAILPANLVRDMPWGSSNAAWGGLDPAPFLGTIVDNRNSQIIAINNALHGINGLHAGDVRRNYNLIGTTWVTDDTGQYTPPDSNWINSPGNKSGFNLGTNQLSNSTMESFSQSATPDRSSNNCLTCHVVALDIPGQPSTVRPSTSISHIFDDLLPLP